MNNLIEIDGKFYHADDDGNPYVDEDDELIPSWKCICYAYSAIECDCGGWDRPIPGYESDE